MTYFVCNRHLCELVWPKLSYQRSLERKMLLIDGILEIQRQETNLNFLTKELHEVISDADNIRREHSKQPKYVLYVNECYIFNLNQIVSLLIIFLSLSNN